MVPIRIPLSYTPIVLLTLAACGKEVSSSEPDAGVDGSPVPHEAAESAFDSSSIEDRRADVNVEDRNTASSDASEASNDHLDVDAEKADAADRDEGPDTASVDGAPPSDAVDIRDRSMSADAEPPSDATVLIDEYRVDALRLTSLPGAAFLVQAAITVENVGVGTPPINSLSFRYYFTDERQLDQDTARPLIFFDYAGWNSSTRAPFNTPLSCRGEWVKIVPPRAGADTYIEVSCATPILLEPRETVQIQLRLFDALDSGTTENAANDYSYMALSDGASSTTNEHIVVLQQGRPVWGTEPP